MRGGITEKDDRSITLTSSEVIGKKILEFTGDFFG